MHITDEVADQDSTVRLASVRSAALRKNQIGPLTYERLGSVVMSVSWTPLEVLNFQCAVKKIQLYTWKMKFNLLTTLLVLKAR